MANFWQSSDGRESGPTASRFGVPRNTAVISSMASSSPSDGTNDRCGNRSLMAGSSLGDFCIKGGTEIPRPSFKNARLVLNQAAYRPRPC